jgi:hypothetical protein
MLAQIVAAVIFLPFCRHMDNLPTGHVRHVMLHLFLRDETAYQAAIIVNNVYGEGSTSKRSCYDWFTKFRAGDKTLEDKKRGGRPVELDASKLAQLVSENNLLSTRELGVSLGVDHATVARHLLKLGFHQVFGRWLPHLLTEAQKGLRASTCASHLTRWRRYSFLPHLITGDEKWMLTLNVDRKRQ